MAQPHSRAAAHAHPAKDRGTLYEEITSKIIAELEAGRLPWVQPWGSAGVRAPVGLPKNAATGRTYSGINVLILWAAVVENGFAGQSWLTYRQAAGLGGHVRKGERGTTVVYADRLVPDDVRDRARDRGEEPRGIPFLKRFTVFNVEQCQGLPEGIGAEPPAVDTSLILPQVEELIRASRADIRIGGDKAYYDVAGDYIRVPPPQAFYEPINWHRTAVHELSHWSGAQGRLARDLSGSFGSKPYIIEELCALSGQSGRGLSGQFPRLGRVRTPTSWRRCRDADRPARRAISIANAQVLTARSGGRTAGALHDHAVGTAG